MNKHTPKKHILIAYHANCIDGFTSAWVTEKALAKEGDNVIDKLPMDYNEGSLKNLKDKLEDIENKEYQELFVVDFSLPIRTIADIATAHPTVKVTILDHHKTAFEAYRPGIEVHEASYIEATVMGATILLDNSLSGAGLCWEYFRGKGTRKPELVKYVQDYDLWEFTYGKETRAVNAYLKKVNKTIEDWDAVASRLEIPKYKERIIEEGMEVLAEFDKKVNSYAKNAAFLTLANKKGYCVECPAEYSSAVGNVVANRFKTFCATYCFDMETGRDFKWSLRSVGDIDVSTIAKFYGGGGHKNAAGFRMNTARSNRILGETSPTPMGNLLKIITGSKRK